MDEIQDIFNIWPSIEEMASDLGELPDTVYRWRKKGRIPAHVWPELIEKAATREHLVTAAQLMKLCVVKRQGRPRRHVAA